MAASATGLLHSDDLCHLLPQAHDADAHRWAPESERPSGPESHCYLCHWLRALDVAPPQAVVVVMVASEGIRPTGISEHNSRFTPCLPARSPPL